MDWHLFREWRIADKVGLILAIVALGLGIYHLAEIRKTVTEVNRVHSDLTTQLQQSERSLRQVRETLSTRYLGKFPEFMPQIVETVGNAREKLVIFCDLPGYGAFSDPANQTRYLHLIEDKRLKPGFSVELTCMDLRNRRDYVSEQFTLSGWEHWERDPAKRTKVTQFCDAHGIPRSSVRTRAQLIAAIESVGQETLRHTFLNAAREVPAKMPIYFWMADDRKSAVFAIPALSPDALEYGFATSDRDLMTALMELRNRYLKGAPVVAQTPQHH